MFSSFPKTTRIAVAVLTPSEHPDSIVFPWGFYSIVFCRKYELILMVSPDFLSEGLHQDAPAHGGLYRGRASCHCWFGRRSRRIIGRVLGFLEVQFYRALRDYHILPGVLDTQEVTGSRPVPSIHEALRLMAAGLFCYLAAHRDMSPDASPTGRSAPILPKTPGNVLPSVAQMGTLSAGWTPGYVPRRICCPE